MTAFAITCLILQLTALYAMSTNIQPKNPNNLYDNLVTNCPNQELNNTLFREQKVFKKCQNWEEISKTDMLEKGTEEKVLCLLFFESFISFCTELTNSKVSNIIEKQLNPDLKDYQSKDVCKNFSKGKKFKHPVLENLNDEAICYKLCVTYDRSLLQECALAHYYINYKATKPVPIEVQNVNIQPKVDSPKQDVIDSHNLEISGVQGNTQSNVNSPKQDKINSPNLKLNDLQGNTQPKVDSPQQVIIDSHNLKLSGIQRHIERPQQNQENHEEKVVQASENVLVNKNAVLTSKKSESSSVNVAPSSNNQPTLKSETSSVISAKKDVQIENKVDLDSVKKEATQEIAVEDNVEGEVNVKQTPSKETGETHEVVETPLETQVKIDTTLSEMDIAADQKDSLVPPDQIGESEDEEEALDPNFHFSDKDDAQDQASKNVGTAVKNKEKPSTLTVSGDLPVNYNTVEDLDGESYFFSYFMVVCVLFILGYVGYHNRQKVMALMLEGKRGRRQVRGRRPNSANYHKLDSNLEEALSSNCTKNSSHVIY